MTCDELTLSPDSSNQAYREHNILCQCKKQAHSPTKQACAFVAVCCFVLCAAIVRLTKQELHSMLRTVRDDELRLANSGGFSDHR